MGYKTITFGSSNASDTIDIYHNRPHFTSTLSYSYNSSNNKITFTVKFGSEFTDNWGYFHYKMGFRAVSSKSASGGYTSTSSVDLFGSGNAVEGQVSSLSALTKTVDVPANGILYVQIYCDGCKAEKNNSSFIGLNTGHGLYKFVLEDEDPEVDSLKLKESTTTSLKYQVTMGDGFDPSYHDVRLDLDGYDEDLPDSDPWANLKSVRITSKSFTYTFTNLDPNTKYRIEVIDYDASGSGRLARRKDKTLKDFVLKSLSYRTSATSLRIDYKINFKYSYSVKVNYKVKDHNTGSSISNSSIEHRSPSNDNVSSYNLTFNNLKMNNEYEIELDFIGYSKETFVNSNNETVHRVEVIADEGREKYYNNSSKSGNPPVKTKKLNFNSINFTSNYLEYSLSCSAVDAYDNYKSSNINIRSALYKISTTSNAGSLTANNVYGSVSINPNGSTYTGNTISSNIYSIQNKISSLSNSYIENNINKIEEYYIYAMIVDNNSGSLLNADANNDSIIRIGPIKLDNLLLKFDTANITTYTHSIKALVKSYLTRNQSSINYSYLKYTAANGTISVSNTNYTNINNIMTQYTYNDPLTSAAYNFLSDTSNFPRAEAVKDNSNDKYSSNTMVIGRCGSANINSNHYIIFSNLPYPYCYYDLYAKVIDAGNNAAIANIRTNTTFPYIKIYTKLSGESSESWHNAIPYIYSGGEWKKAIGKVYNNSDWQDQGSGNQAE